jgi:hypothetical protein
LALLGVTEPPWRSRARLWRRLFFALAVALWALFWWLFATPNNFTGMVLVLAGFLAAVPFALYATVQQANHARKWFTHDSWPLLNITLVRMDTLIDTLHNQLYATVWRAMLLLTAARLGFAVGLSLNIIRNSNYDEEGYTLIFILFVVLVFEPLLLSRAISAVVLAWHTARHAWPRMALAGAAALLVMVLPSIIALLTFQLRLLERAWRLLLPFINNNQAVLATFAVVLVLLFGGALVVTWQAQALVRRNITLE